MDHSTSERLSIPLLGESHPGHVGGAIHGWGGNLRGCGLCPLSGKSTRPSVLSCVAAATLIDASGWFDNSFCSSLRRTLFLYGIRPPVTKQPQPESGILFGACLTYLPTPLWNTKLTPTASSTCWGGWGGQVPELSRNSSIVGPRRMWAYMTLTCGVGTHQPLQGFGHLLKFLLVRTYCEVLWSREPFCRIPVFLPMLASFLQAVLSFLC